MPLLSTQSLLGDSFLSNTRRFNALRSQRREAFLGTPFGGTPLSSGIAPFDSKVDMDMVSFSDNETKMLSNEETGVDLKYSPWTLPSSPFDVGGQEPLIQSESAATGAEDTSPSSLKALDASSLRPPQVGGDTGGGETGKFSLKKASNIAAAIGTLAPAAIQAFDKTPETDAPDIAASAIGGAAQGAMLGATLGPPGMAIGAVVGGTIGLATSVGQRKQEQKKKRKDRRRAAEIASAGIVQKMGDGGVVENPIMPEVEPIGTYNIASFNLDNIWQKV